jgi:hypothetical protein
VICVQAICKVSKGCLLVFNRMTRIVGDYFICVSGFSKDSKFKCHVFPRDCKIKKVYFAICLEQNLCL